MSDRPTKRRKDVARARSSAQGSGRGAWILAGVIVIVGVVALVALLATRGGNSNDAAGGVPSPSGGTVVPSGDLAYGEVVVTGAPLATLPQSGADPAVGKPIPDVAGQTFNGDAMSITKNGKPKIIMLLAHWCPHCQVEVPRVQAWLDANGMPADIELAAVTTSTDAARPNYPPGAWLRREGWSVPTMVDDKLGTAGVAYGLSSFPFFVVVDAQGNVVGRATGELSDAAWVQLLTAARQGAPATTVPG